MHRIGIQISKLCKTIATTVENTTRNTNQPIIFIGKTPSDLVFRDSCSTGVALCFGGMPYWRHTTAKGNSPTQWGLTVNNGCCTLGTITTTSQCF